MRISLVVLLCLAAVGAAVAGDLQQYVAPLDRSEWLVRSDTEGCHLAHPIPGFGTALFSLDAESNLSLRVLADWPAASSGMAELHLLAPAWRRGHDRHLQNTRYVGDGAAFEFSHHTTRRILNALAAGDMPALRFADWFGEGQVQVAVSPVNYRPAAAGFGRCARQLGTANPASYAGQADLLRGLEARGTELLPAAERTEEPPAGSPLRPAAARSGAGRPDDQDDALSVYFASDNAGLTRPAILALRRLAVDLRQDPRWQQLILIGHADERGDELHNKRLGLARAEQVKQHLVALGVPAARIQTRTVGAREPAEIGNAPAALAHNRRVVIRLQLPNRWEQVRREQRIAALQYVLRSDAPL